MKRKLIIISILSSGLILSTGATLAKGYKPCKLSPYMKKEVQQLKPFQKKVVRKAYKKSCFKTKRINRRIKAKLAMLDATMRQPKVNTYRINKLVKQVNRLRNKKLRTIVQRNIKISGVSDIRLGVPTGKHHIKTVYKK